MSYFPAQKTFFKLCTEKQKAVLISEFSCCPYLTSERKEYLSTKLGIESNEIASWFLLRRKYICSIEVQINWNGNYHNYTLMSLFLSLCQFVCVSNCFVFPFVNLNVFLSACTMFVPLLVCLTFTHFGSFCLTHTFSLTLSLTFYLIVHVLPSVCLSLVCFSVRFCLFVCFVFVCLSVCLSLSLPLSLVLSVKLYFFPSLILSDSPSLTLVVSFLWILFTFSWKCLYWYI